MLQQQTVSKECLNLIRRLMEIRELESFRLAGGTALALQRGHRLSIDIDLFSGKEFDNDQILMALEAYLFPERPQNVRTFSFGFFCELNEIKTDFMFWGDDFIGDPVVIEGIRMAGSEDLFAMKLNAICNRKTKKDFFDLAVLLEDVSLKSGIECYSKKYPYNDVASVLKQLSNTAEAEAEPDPTILISLSWEQTKAKIAASLKHYWHSEIGS